MMNHIKILSGIIVALLIFSCSVATESKELEVPNQTFSFEDIYEGGGNTASIALNMKELIGSVEGIGSESIEDASMKSITLTKDDSIAFGDLVGAEFMLSADNEDIEMVTVGILKEVDAGAKTITLSLMEDVELGDFLKEENVYLTMDANFNKDMEEVQKINAGIKFDVQVEKQ